LRADLNRIDSFKRPGGGYVLDDIAALEGGVTKGMILMRYNGRSALRKPQRSGHEECKGGNRYTDQQSAGQVRPSIRANALPAEHDSPFAASGIAGRGSGARFTVKHLRFGNEPRHRSGGCFS